MLAFAWLLAPVPIVIMYFVPGKRLADGSSVTILCDGSHEYVPEIVGDTMIAASVADVFMISEKATVMLESSDTFLVPLAGKVLMTTGLIPVVKENV